MADTEKPILILAQDVKAALYEMFPQLCFRFYRPIAHHSRLTDLYVFGYNERWQLIGGYTFKFGEDALRISLQVLSAIQFFQKTTRAPSARFFPPSLQTMYEDYRRAAVPWQPLLYLPEAVWV